jgi:ribonuclease HI
LYCDGSDDAAGFISVENGKICAECVYVYDTGISKKNDDTESEAILHACVYAFANPSNWVVYTDSKAIIDKIERRVANATKNPNINGIRKILDRCKSSPLPVSIEIKWKARCSDQYMRQIDALVSRKNHVQNN